MTTRSRRALYRVRNSAHRFVQAVEALKPQDLAELPWLTRLMIGFARVSADSSARRLTGLLHFGEGLPGDVATVESYAKAKDPEDALMEARDVGREMAEEES